MTSCSNAQHSEACCFSTFVRHFFYSPYFCFLLLTFFRTGFVLTCLRWCISASSTVSLSLFSSSSTLTLAPLLDPGPHMLVGGETLSGNQAKKKQKERKSFLSEFLMFLILFLLTFFLLLLSKFHLCACKILTFSVSDYVIVPNCIHVFRFHSNTLLL